jgi:hypothetical protein
METLDLTVILPMIFLEEPPYRFLQWLPHFTLPPSAHTDPSAPCSHRHWVLFCVHITATLETVKCLPFLLVL